MRLFFFANDPKILYSKSMRKYLSTFLVVLFTISLVAPTPARAEIPAKAKAFLMISTYGAAGGALLGAASLAFGGKPRSIAQGASLGLYAGIIFGTYVLVSHHNKRYGSYDDYDSPYTESRDVYGNDYQEDQGGSSESSGGRGGFFDRHQAIEGKFQKKGGSMPPFQVNFFSYSF